MKISKIVIIIPITILISMLVFGCALAKDFSQSIDEEIAKEPVEEKKEEIQEEKNKVEEEIIKVKLFMDDMIPLDYKEMALDSAKNIFDEVSLATEKSQADIVISLDKQNQDMPFSLFFVPVTSFYSLAENINWDDFIAYWNGQEGHDLNLFVDESIRASLETVLGECKINNVEVKKQDIPGILEEENNFSIIPFDKLSKNYKVLSIGGNSIFSKNLNEGDYPLIAGLNISGENELASKLKQALKGLPFSNRDESKLLTINMTGVTALVRGTANRMDRHGVLYPGEKIVDILKDADITHISNEIPFVEGCVGARDSDLVFCSKPEYIELLRYVGTDVVELTGNHMNDYGPDEMNNTLDMYDKEGWPYFGGGRNLDDSYKPAIFEIGPNKIAFLGFNFFGPAYDWATEDRPGSAPPNFEDFEKIISEYDKNGYNVIFTFQYVETYNYYPTEQQVIDFRRMRDAGAAIISGSQSHHPMGVELSENGFINYGLGNLFFDQMRSLGMRQGIIAKHVFYDNKHINTVLITTMLEDYCQPRPTEGEERNQLLNSIFEHSLK